jgi:putative oxidoreductase
MATTLNQRPGLALAILRIATGIIFIAHGAQKLFVYGIGGTTGAFNGMGIPLAEVAAPAVALIEFLGGIALVLGIFSRVAATLLAATMLGAMVMVHAPNGFFLPSGIEFTLTLLAATAAIALGGPGALALDDRLRGRRLSRAS